VVDRLDQQHRLGGIRVGVVVAPEDRDVHDPLQWKDQVLCHPDERAALYEQAQVIFNQDQPSISMPHTRMFTAMRNNVEGDHISPLTTNNFATSQVK